LRPPIDPAVLEKANQGAHGRDVVIVFRPAGPGSTAPAIVGGGGRETTGTNLSLTLDRAGWLASDGRPHSVPLSAIEEIHHRTHNSLSAMLQGAGLGVLVGAAGGGLVGGLTYSEGNRDSSRPWAAIQGAILGGAVGLLAGGIAGAILGDTVAILPHAP